MNGVQVFASVGNAGAGDGHVRREEEVRKEAEMFAVVASTAHGRREVSWYIVCLEFCFVSCTLCAHLLLFFVFTSMQANILTFQSILLSIQTHNSSLSNAHG